MPPTIAFIAHDRKKDDVAELAKRHKPLLAKYRLIATGTTGQRIRDAAGLEVECMLSGPLGGDAQIAAQVATKTVAAVIFLIDPLHAEPYEPDIRTLLRICEVHNIPFAINLATAEAIIASLVQKQVAHLIFNPASGGRDAIQDLEQIHRNLDPHLNLHVYEMTSEDNPVELAQEAIAAGAKMVLASGGDGTVSGVAEALVGTGIPLGIIPRGTANAFALTLGITPAINPIDAACNVILQGKTRVLDAATCNGQVMILLTGIGYEAEAVEKASQELKQQWGAFAYLVAGWQQLNEQLLFEAEIEVEGKIQTVQAGAITIANAAPATSILAQGGGQVISDDGLLDVTIATVENRFQALSAMLGMLGATLTRTSSNNRNVVHFSTPHIKVRTTPPQKVVVDGEVIGTTPVEVECIPAGLTVFVPE